MEIYKENSMVKKDHAKLIAEKLVDLGSNVPKSIRDDLSQGEKNEYSLALLLSLACGGSTHKLTMNEILQINNESFLIKESSLQTLFEKSPSRQK